MRISLQALGKRYNREWIFRNLSYEFISGRSYAITGPNGSGKSTLLQIISGASAASEGIINWHDCKPENVYKLISIAAPYLELVEEMTLKEFLIFHSGLKPFIAGFTTNKILSIFDLDHASGKQIRYFSSGMKQRVKLAQTFFSQVPIILLDEPCTNLDEQGVLLYKKLVSEYCKDRLLIISSNDKKEYDFCDEVINLTNFKKLSPAGN